MSDREEKFRMTFHQIRRLGGVALTIVCGTTLLAPPAGAQAEAEAALAWYGARNKHSKINWLYADDTCEHGSEDCNRCAPNVEMQWQHLSQNNSAISWHERKWHFGWDRDEAPSGLTPNDTWDVGSMLLWDQLEHHVQGFVRTNDPYVKYAMSHSDDDFGSLTFVSSSYDVYAIHETFSAHPSGIFSLGRYVGMVDGEDTVRFFDTQSALASHALYFFMGPADTQSDYGVANGYGGLAMAKLDGGGYLMVVGQGGLSNDYQETYLFFTDGPVTSPYRKEHLGTIPGTYPTPYGQSENISLITECGTRSIYVVHMSGSNGPGVGWYRLSRVGWDSNGPTLQHVAIRTANSYWEYCHHRSAASASVRDNGYIDLYCHQRANANGSLSGPGDDWEFREGLNYYNWPMP